MGPALKMGQNGSKTSKYFKEVDFGANAKQEDMFLAFFAILGSQYKTQEYSSQKLSASKLPCLRKSHRTKVICRKLLFSPAFPHQISNV